MKKSPWYFDRDCIPPVALALGNTVILILLIPPNQEHGVSFHLFVSFIGFFHWGQFSEYRSFTSLSGLMPRYFILFDTMVNGINSLNSLSDSLLFVYRKGTDLCMLILYLATFPNSVMSYSSFLVASLGHSMYSIMSPANNDRFTSFPVWSLFLLWSLWLQLPKLCWIEVAGVDLIVLFLILAEILSAFHHWEC